MSRSVKIRKNVVTDLLREERGIVAVIFAILLPLFLGLAALAIDMSYAYKVRNTTQVTSSAAALAGVSQLNDANGNDNPNDDDVPDNASEDYRREAIEYAYRNMPEAVHGNVVSALCGSFDPATDAAGVDDLECDDIQAGHWDGATFHYWDGASYIPATMEIDALQVQTHRAAGGGNDNPLQLFFAGALGLAQTDINTTAVATTGGGEITNGCLIALNNEDGEDQTFKLNGTAEVTTIGCDIRVDQCCTDPTSCKQGALRANGTVAVVLITAETCGVDETCEGPGVIDVCGTVLEQGEAYLDATVNCTGDGGSNMYTDAMCEKPSYDDYDPLTDFAYDKSDEWAILAGSGCEFTNFEITKLDDPTYEYYSPGDVTSVTEPKLDTNGNPVLDPDTGEVIMITTKTYTLHPGTYCGDGSKNSKAIKFAGGGSSPNIIFDYDVGGNENQANGVYVIKNGKLDLASSGNISCEKCGFYLAGDPATLDWTGSNNIDLSASGTGPLEGLLVVQDTCSTAGCDPLTPENQEISIAGSNEGSYYGGFYVPNADVKIVGTVGTSSSPESDCLWIIADEMDFRGGSEFTANSSCGAFGGTNFSPAPLFYTLVN